MIRRPLGRALAAGLVLAGAAVGVVNAGALTDFTVDADAPPERVVKAGVDRLGLGIEVRCSAACEARVRGSVLVEHRGKPDLDLRLRGEPTALDADEAGRLKARIGKRATRRLQAALDSRGTEAVAYLEVVAASSGSDEVSAQDETALRPGFDVVSKDVSPGLAFFDGSRKPKLVFRIRASAPAGARILVREGRSGSIVRGWKLSDVAPFARNRLRWNGLDRRGRAARDGTYSFHVGKSQRTARRAGSFRLRGHHFPVAGPHGTRGGIGDFGAPRNGGRRHEGFDITASCGTNLVAARGGKVVRRGFDPVLYGWFVDIRGRKSGRRFFYSHLRVAPPVKSGDRVRTGQRVGEVGQTGNAKSTPCHLHFEIRDGGRPVDPLPLIRRWDRWS